MSQMSTETQPPVIADSAAAMAALMGTTVQPDGTLPMPGVQLPATTVAPVAPAAVTPAAPAAPGVQPAPAATPTAAEVVALTGEEAIARVNALVQELADARAEGERWKAQSRQNERAKRAARAALKDAGSQDPPADPAANVHTGLEDDGDDVDTFTLRQENMRLRAALAAGLDVTDAARLVGNTDAELLADAQAFKARISTSPTRPQGRGDGGAGFVLKTLSPQEQLAQVIAQGLRR
jgi:hypothetical protein